MRSDIQHNEEQFPAGASGSQKILVEHPEGEQLDQQLEDHGPEQMQFRSAMSIELR